MANADHLSGLLENLRFIYVPIFFNGIEILDGPLGSVVASRHSGLILDQGSQS